MDQLSSCYFCSAALDASLEEYPVVPEQLHPTGDAQKTVVLCGTCRRKLDAVLDTVVDAVEDESQQSGGGEQSVGSKPSAETQSNGDTDAASSDIETTLGDDEDVLQSLGSENGHREGQSEGSDGSASASNRSDTSATADDSDDSTESDDSDDSDDSEKSVTYGDSRGAGWTREHNQSSRTSGSTSPGPSSSSRSSDGQSSGGQPSSGNSSDGQRSGSEQSGNEQSNNDRRTDADDSSGETASGTGSSSGGSSQDVNLTRLENTKVMRLLQNREFPVDREEFVVVASNAYEISQSDCEKVIDLGVEHGLLEEDKGLLLAGPHWS